MFLSSTLTYRKCLLFWCPNDQWRFLAILHWKTIWFWSYSSDIAVTSYNILLYQKCSKKWLNIAWKSWLLCQFLQSEFFRIFDKNFWSSKKVIEYCLKKLMDFFCCCYWASCWSGFCLTFCQLALVVVKENNNCSTVTEKVSR